jgi:hypothetical protein
LDDGAVSGLEEGGGGAGSDEDGAGAGLDEGGGGGGSDELIGPVAEVDPEPALALLDGAGAAEVVPAGSLFELESFGLSVCSEVGSSVWWDPLRLERGAALSGRLAVLEVSSAGCKLGYVSFISPLETSTHS